MSYSAPPPQYGQQPQPGGSPIQNFTIASWGFLGAAFITFISGFFPWYTASYGPYSASENGWHRFSLITLLVALAVGVALALAIFKVFTPPTTFGWAYVGGGAVAFLFAIIAMIDAFNGGGAGDVAKAYGVDTGPSFGTFLGLIASAALTYFGALAAQEAGLKLPFTVPGPGAK